MPKVPWVSEGAEKVIADWEKITGKVRLGKDATKDLAKANQELGAVATRVLREVETGQERVNRKLDQARQLHKAGKLSVEELNQVTTRLSTTNERTFGQQAIGRLGSYAAGFIGISSAVGLVSNALRTMERDAQQAADRTFAALGAFGELQQVSASPEEFQKNVGFARSLVARGVVSPDNQAQAADITFALRSANFTDAEMEMFAGAAQKKLVKAEGLEGLGAGLRKYQSTFGAEEAGDLEAVFRKVISASATAQATIPETVAAITQFGGGARALGMSDEEAVASFLAVEKSAPNPEVAATRMKTFLEQVDKRGLMKGSFQETLSSIQGRIDKGENAFDVLGESRAVEGFRAIMRERQVSLDQRGTLEEAQRTDLIGQRTALLETDPILAAAQARAQSEGALASGRERRSPKESLFDAIRADVVEHYESQGMDAEALAQRSRFGVIDMLGMEERQIRGAAEGRFQGVSAETQRQAQEYMRRTAEASEKQARILEDNARNGTNLGRQE